MIRNTVELIASCHSSRKKAFCSSPKMLTFHFLSPFSVVSMALCDGDTSSITRSVMFGLVMRDWGLVFDILKTFGSIHQWKYLFPHLLSCEFLMIKLVSMPSVDSLELPVST